MTFLRIATLIFLARRLIRAEGVHTPPLGAEKGYAHLSAIPREKQHTPLLAVWYVDWTFKYKKFFLHEAYLELKLHVGWTIFNANTFHFQEEYSGLSDTDNNYGTGTNMKFAITAWHPAWGKFHMDTAVYFVYSVFQNRDNDTGGTLGLFIDASYSHPIGKTISIGIGASMLRETSYYDHLQNTGKWTNIVRVFTEWKLK
ncbi:MAG: hypothetical protein Ta2A_18910 [Treponemataceae bacterium]|nr:MAG: hypothetical protein Ta2A_18910 [Treponemataceae bacterium]